MTIKEHLKGWYPRAEFSTSHSPDLDNIPLWWQKALTLSGQARIGRVVEQWTTQKAILPRVVRTLEEKLRDVCLMRSENRRFLAYHLETDDDDFCVYLGGNPSEAQFSNTVAPVWSQTDEHLQAFYSSMHDGWSYAPANVLGLLPSRQVFFLDDSAGTRELLVLFSNGGSAYLCHAIGKREFGDMIWWGDGEPTLNINFLQKLDEWIESGIEG